ncbi:D-lyxose/D-mannose family sugar isomerase [Amedibacillus sp. YH-ame10]
MKRSEMNEIIQYTLDATKKFNMPLPPFATYGIEDWKNVTEEEKEIVDNMLGWDITDFGSNDFDHIGLTIFTFRNGNFHDHKTYPKPYCEKLLFVRDGQFLPFHFHFKKIEDIINRGGGDLEITMYNSKEDGSFDDTDVLVSVDAKTIKVEAGGKVVLKPGQSVTLFPGQYHQWQGVPGTGDVMLFEVSTTNDDMVDNRFYEAKDRIPSVEEDCEASYLIFADYKNHVNWE